MAVLTEEQKRTIMRNFIRDASVLSPSVTKANVYAAVQAIEDEMETTVKPAMATEIDTAVSPGILDNTEKKKLFKHYLPIKFDLE